MSKKILSPRKRREAAEPQRRFSIYFVRRGNDGLFSFQESITEKMTEKEAIRMGESVATYGFLLDTGYHWGNPNAPKLAVARLS